MQYTAQAATATSDIAVELRSVSKHFDQNRPTSLFKRERVRVHALDNVSFSIRRGEFCAYAGPNGAGKSTTFKLLAGMLLPQSGSVRALGLSPAEDRIALMRKTGVLFGNRSELWWDHPVRASFEWKKAVWDVPDAVYAQQTSMLRELLGLDDFWSCFARELSLGQRMRANLALTLLHAPELLLLDEPTLGLDVLAKRQMMAFLKLLNAERGVTILVTSHDMDDLAEMARRLILINRGTLAFDGDHATLARHTGDVRVLRVRTAGEAPRIPEARLIAREGDRYEYEYDARRCPTAELFRALAALPDATDIELEHAPIERVIADLYERWQRGED